MKLDEQLRDDAPPPRLLATLCNNPRAGPETPLLGVLDFDLTRFRHVPLPDDLALTADRGAGLALDGDLVHVAFDGPGSNRLLTLERATLRPLRVAPLPEANAVHSIAVVGNDLYVVSTGTDALLRYRFADRVPREPEVVWRPDPALSFDDHHHLNGLLPAAGGFLLAGLDLQGRMGEVRQRHLLNGFVMHAPSGSVVAEGLQHPHTVARIGETVACCHSDARAVHLFGCGLLRGLPGFSRGLAKHGDAFFVGSSGASAFRRRPPIGAAAWRCTISRFDTESLDLTARIDLSAWAVGIYDLLVV